MRAVIRKFGAAMSYLHFLQRRTSDNLPERWLCLTPTKSLSASNQKQCNRRELRYPEGLDLRICDDNSHNSTGSVEHFDSSIVETWGLEMHFFCGTKICSGCGYTVNLRFCLGVPATDLYFVGVLQCRAACQMGGTGFWGRRRGGGGGAGGSTALHITLLFPPGQHGVLCSAADLEHPFLCPSAPLPCLCHPAALQHRSSLLLQDLSHLIVIGDVTWWVEHYAGALSILHA